MPVSKLFEGIVRPKLNPQSLLWLGLFSNHLITRGLEPFSLSWKDLFPRLAGNAINSLPQHA